MTSNKTPARAKTKSRSKYTATEISASTESFHAFDRIPPVSKRDLEDLLWARAEAVATPDIDFNSFDDLALNQWKTRSNSRSNQEGFRMYSNRIITPNIPPASELLITGELDCSLAEAAALFRSPEEERFNYTMNSLHERSFQHGSVVHSFTSRSEVTPNEYEFLRRYRCVKTALFSHPRLALFDGDDRWCFLEEFDALKTGLNGFTLSQRTLQPSTLPRALRPPIELIRRDHGLKFKRSNRRTHQLLGLSLGFLIEEIPGKHPAAVRLVFYGCCVDEETGDFTVAQRRMKRLARGVFKLPALVRRRRMSAQVPADISSITNLATKYPPESSRCVSCSKTLHWLRMAKKSHCYLCGHLVCSRCWIRQPLDSANGRRISVIICSSCLNSVQNCNYAYLAASSLSGRGSGSSASTSTRISMFAGGIGEEFSFHTTEVLPDHVEDPEPGHNVAKYLENVLCEEDSDSETSISKADTALNVLQQLVRTLDEGVNRVLAHSSFHLEDSDSPELEITSILHKLRSQFEREVLPLKACVLSNAVTRTYPLDTEAGLPVGPVPPNEANRIEAVIQQRLLVSRGSEELVLICELAARELNCMTALVTIVGSALQYVIASNSLFFQDADLPREHTLCQHLLMGDRPMLVQHPEADIRFCNLQLVIDYGIQFYAGFPIFSDDGLSVVGSLCCLDAHSRDMTQSQYSTLLHLTRTATNIMSRKCQQPRILQPLKRHR
ncbi:hypothetical protein P3T76_008974 [Phytophthora citrophthora]|uniref:FYVE-type domain-containing protein n=1 Tax=Phytophthora citrophthora TaxID=4793 RepID=A0AAD9GI88_9STRA|nr:hypothetical protein P3T76_008974 [Phytophthora citrophthora]